MELEERDGPNGRFASLQNGLLPQTERRILESLRSQADHHQGSDRKQSSKLLLTGSVSGLLGFLFAFVIGLIKSETGDKFDHNGRPFPSGRGYFPATVSEMVHDPQDPAGKVFFCFEFVGALLIFISWYPSRLRSVYVGDDIKVPGLNMSWVTFRQFVPAPGMMMLSVITTVPFPKADIQDYFCITLHLVGAMMMFVGYFVVEAQTVGWWFFSNCRCGLRHKLHETAAGIWWRHFWLAGVFWFYTLFCVLQVVLCIQLPFLTAEDYDEWELDPMTRKIELVDTAHWPVKVQKIASYTSEVFCGLCLIASHLSIWYYCEERLYDLPEELPSMRTLIREGAEVPEEYHSDDEEEEDEESDDFGGYAG